VPRWAWQCESEEGDASWRSRRDETNAVRATTASEVTARASEEMKIRLIAATRSRAEADGADSEAAAGLSSEATTACKHVNLTVPMMAHYNIYRDRIVTTHPAFGHCMPSESLVQTEGMAVRIGDIGYVSEGKFPHIFNALFTSFR
jgi:hypothetical protein